MMATPCKMVAPDKDSDKDLEADVQNADCVRRLRLQVYQLQEWIRNVTSPQ